MISRSHFTGKGRFALAFMLAAGLLSACGGSNDAGSSGGGSGTVPPPITSQVPDSASASASGFIAFLQQLIITMADTLEPVDTSGVTATADDKSEPTKVD